MDSQEEEIRCGDCFYDYEFDRWLEVDGICINPHCWACVVYVYGDPGEREIAGRGIFHESYLRGCVKMNNVLERR